MIPDAVTKIRVLRAKVGELEAFVKDGAPKGEPHVWLAADIALVAEIVSEILIDQTGGME
jgi:hypothetical protein